MIIVLLSLFSGVVHALPLRQFFPYGWSTGDISLPVNDDSYSSSIPIPVSFPFFGDTHRSLYVNNNGDISFVSPLSQYTSAAFPITGSHHIIAPFWTDIDTSNGGTVWYRQSVLPDLLHRGTNKIRSVFPELSNFEATWMIVVTWEDVAFFGADTAGKRKRNTFQAALLTDGTHSFAIFNYNKITWTTGTASDGDSTTGLGGTPAQVGFNNGDGVHYFSVAGSRTSAVLNLPSMSNIGIPGEFVFRIDEANIRSAATNHCASSPCRHGTCGNLVNTYTCHCDPGYTGVNCQTDINECLGSPCRHGNCIDLVNTYTCHCDPGYTGVNCQTDINECLSSPCRHGNCSDLVNMYTCHCDPGYTDINCQTDINECLSSPCRHGNCSDLVNMYTCHCDPGYTGVNCQTDINECLSSPCRHGNCSDLVNMYTCHCDPGYTDINCQTDINECLSSPCRHGNCSDLVNMYTCHCDPGYTGVNCQTDINECLSSPCRHGNCSDLVNMYTCHCDPGYTGVNCQTDIDECVSSPCVHGACVDDVNKYTCACDTVVFVGIRCSTLNLSLLVPAVFGALLSLIFLLFVLWKRFRRETPEDCSGIVLFEDSSIGPAKKAYWSKGRVAPLNLPYS